MPSCTLKESGARGTTNEKKHDEEAAASALALLSSPTIKPPSSFGEPEPATSEASTLKDGDISESEESYTSQNEVLPKAVHTPPLNDMMVNHTYIDYSVIEEEHLSFLEEGNETTTNRIALNDEDKKATNNRVAKIRKIFGDVGPSKKNSGGVVRPFPEKVSQSCEIEDAGGGGVRKQKSVKDCEYFLLLYKKCRVFPRFEIVFPKKYLIFFLLVLVLVLVLVNV